MKKVFYFLISIFLCAQVFAEKNVCEYELSNGIPVYYLENTTNKVDAVYIGVKGGVFNYSPEDSGLEKACFQMMLKGSKNFSYTQQQSMTYETSAALGSASGTLGSVLYLSCIDDYLEECLPFLLDGFINPVFNEKEYSKLINDFENGLQETLNDPYSIGLDFVIKRVYQNHPFGTFAYPTMESINNITLKKIKKLHPDFLDSSRIYIVAVTKKSAETVLPIFESYLGNLSGKNKNQDFEIPNVSVKNVENIVLSHPSASGTAFIYRNFAAPSSTDEDYIAFIMAQSIYDQIMHNVVRAKYGDCYSAWCGDFGRKANVGYEVLYRVSDFSKVKAHLQEAREIMSSGKYITGTTSQGDFIFADIETGFESFRNAQINKLYLSEMTTSSRASKISNSLLVWNSVDGTDLNRAKINTVTCQEVLDAFNKYFCSNEDFWVGVTGPEDEEILLDILNK